jgi:uncharacterized RDD family membrane protein YckC
VTSRARATVLTPEHVEIHLDPAGLGSRFIALSVDFVIVLAASQIVAALAMTLLPVGAGVVVRALLMLVMSFGYHVYFEVWRQGQSPGKKMLRLRVVDGRGLPMGLEQSFVRNVVRVLDALPIGYAVGAMVSLIHPERRRLGDMVADTMVVNEPRGIAPERRITGARTFNSLRTPRVLRLIRHRVTLEEREFLGQLCWRAATLDPQARFDLMREVGEFYRNRLDIEEQGLSGENLVRGLTAILYADREIHRQMARAS